MGTPRVGWIVILLCAAGCSHAEPFSTQAPDALGPADPSLPRQLTYNLGDDRFPNVTGGSVAFSRYDPARTALGQCVALLPVEGGTLSATFCPPQPSVADTFVSSWLEPSLSPDGTQLAFVWRRSARVSALAAWSYDFVVASTDSPSVPLASQSIPRLLPGDRLVNTGLELTWLTPDRVRFLAAYDSVFKVKGGGAGRFTDTITVPRALMDFDLAAGTIVPVPGGDSLVAYTVADDGTVYVVPDDSARAMLRLGPDGSRTPVGVWPLPVTDIAVSGAVFVAATALDSLYWMDPASGQAGRITLRGTARRLAPAEAGYVVVELERRGGDAFGAPANLWLLGLAVGSVR
ncbi:MAG: hypothetical protein OEY20_05375 [Gemmatimonadota bacterium]|nr:hypothetical protein [Gemmatimonadota bacterium]